MGYRTLDRLVARDTEERQKENPIYLRATDLNRTWIWVAMAITAGSAVVRDHNIRAFPEPSTGCSGAGRITRHNGGGPVCGQAPRQFSRRRRTFRQAA